MNRNILTSMIFGISIVGSHAAIAQEHALQDLVYAHYRCNAEIESKRLSKAEISVCGELYTRLKLHFVKETNWERYDASSTELQSAVSKRGYLAFKAWETANPTVVKSASPTASPVLKST